MKKLLYLFCIVSLVACSKESAPQSASEQFFDLYTAKNLYAVHIDKIVIPNLFTSIAQTKGNYLNEEFNIQWENASYFNNKSSQGYEIPLDTKIELIPILHYLENDTIKNITKNVKIYNSLIIQHLKNSDTVKIFINTIIGKYANNTGNSTDTWSFNSAKENLYGYQIFSNTNGNYISNSFFYNQGAIYKMHLTRKNISEVMVLPAHFFSVYPKETITKAKQPGKGETAICPNPECNYFLVFGDTYCPGCGNPVMWDVILGDYCYKCDSEPCECPGPDDGCIYCGSIDCFRECRELNND